MPPLEYLQCVGSFAARRQNSAFLKKNKIGYVIPTFSRTTDIYAQNQYPNVREP